MCLKAKCSAAYSHSCYVFVRNDNKAIISEETGIKRKRILNAVVAKTKNKKQLTPCSFCMMKAALVCER